MKVKAIAACMSDEMKVAYAIEPDAYMEWEITVGKEYTVYTIGCVPGSSVYGRTTLYRILDDFEALLPIPAAMFEIVDPKVSKYWIAGYQGINFSLQPQEFIDYPSLSEAILDREEWAIDIFQDIIKKMQDENI